jgi:hypothetical protein
MVFNGKLSSPTFNRKSWELSQDQDPNLVPYPLNIPTIAQEFRLELS